jgi:hypothetical protein
MMQQYKNFWISGSAKMSTPNEWVWYVAGEVYRQGAGTSIVGVTNFELPSFEVENRELAEFFGLEVARLVVDKCLSTEPRRMRVLEAVRILEQATLYSHKRNIDTPEVRQALDVLEPYCLPGWLVKGFRDHLQPGTGFLGHPDVEGQQQYLRVCFAGIHASVRRLLHARVKRLEYRYRRTKDDTVKAELDRLTGELEQMPARWEFRVV